MSKALKVFRYQFHDALIAIGIFYLCLMLLTAVLSIFDGSSSGFETASAIFVFVVGLNSFKSSFQFLQFLGVTRKSFLAGSLLALLAVAVGMSIVDTLIGELFAQLHPYTPMFVEFYGMEDFLAQFAWETVMLAMAAFVGFFITMLYYRCNKVMKIVISLSPVYLSLISNVLPVEAQQSIWEVFGFLSGLRSGAGLWGNVLGMLVTVLLSSGLCFLLIRRAPVKG